MARSTYRPDFYDRDGDLLRCRPCGFIVEWNAPRDPEWLNGHVGETYPCPNCGLSSRIPTAEESQWPDRKDHDDPIRGVPQTERPQQGRDA